MTGVFAPRGPQVAIPSSSGRRYVSAAHCWRRTDRARCCRSGRGSGEILECHLRRPVLADRDAGVGADEARSARYGCHPDEVGRPREERREGRRDRHGDRAPPCRPPRRPAAARRCNLEEPVRVAVGELRAWSSSTPRRRARSGRAGGRRGRRAPRRTSSRVAACGTGPVRRPRGRLRPCVLHTAVGHPRHAAAPRRDLAERGDRALGILQRLAVPASGLSSASATPRPLMVWASTAVGRPSAERCGVVGVGDRVDVVPVDALHVPAEGLQSARVGVEIPPEHRRPALPEAVDVDDQR